ncbi:hypothetical protein Ga0061061_1176 [Chelatococcus sambhunathii]|uniref:Uncharacterized protein n=1 Tax=Chelatococcus sambhunathii TaxID=363953 RepID=A0ABM9UD30_9HYPH|nr:hypothetical protein [Chelatococcus sambhunathii]CUA90943.1 hypothetical protein Ga0061061_1176 [Chelatococcus sambhunathii]
MPWASNGQISTSPLSDGIEISEADYLAALDGLAAGQMVSIAGGVFALVEPPKAEPERDDPERDQSQLRPLNPRQLRLGLLNNSISLASVEAAIEAIEDPAARERAIVEWEYAPIYKREHVLIAHIGAALGLTEEQIDDMWSEAQTL